MRTWYYSRDNEIHGPFSDSEMMMLVRTRRLHPDDPVTNDLLDLWYPAQDFTGFDFPELPPLDADQGADEDIDDEKRTSEDSAPHTTHEPALPPAPLELKTPAAVPVPHLPLPPGMKETPSRPTRVPVQEQDETHLRETEVVETIVEVTEEPGETRTRALQEEGPRDSDEADRSPGLTVYTRGKQGTVRHAGENADVLAQTTDVTATVLDGAMDREWHPELTVFHGKQGRRRRTKHDRPHIEYGGVAEHETTQRLAWWQKPLSAPSFRLLLVIALIPIFFFGPTLLLRGCKSESHDLQAKAMKRAESDRSSAAVLGEYLTRKFPGSKALVVVLPEGSARERRKRREALINGLEQGFAGNITVQAADYPQFPVIVEAEIGNTGSRDHVPASWTPPLQYWYSAEVLDKLIAKYPQCDLVVSFVSLPKDYDRMKIWRLPENKRPRVAVAAGNIAGLKKALAKGWVVAAVDHRPATAGNVAQTAGDGAGAAAPPCRLVTPENVSAMAVSHPHLFYE